MSSTPDKLVERYLKHLEVELDDLPRDRRREIVEEIAGHIAEARASLEHESEADVRNILEGLGDPADIAEDARERFDVQPPAAPAQPSRTLEIAALVLLLVGGLILPIAGWVIGVVLLWVSTVWNVRDKIIGTVFVPGGLGLSLFLLFAVGSGAGGEVCSGTVLKGSGGPQAVTRSCTESGTSVGDVIMIVFMTALVIAPIVTTAYLGYRLRQSTRATA